MKLAIVMEALAERIDTIQGLHVSSWPIGKVTPPAAVVSYPTTITLDQTYGRGMDRMKLPIVVVVGKPTERTTRDALAEYCDGSGPRSIKQVLEGTRFDTSILHTVRVESIIFDVVTIAATDLMAAMFNLDVTGQGS